jgi:hypothetical protein
VQKKTAGRNRCIFGIIISIATVTLVQRYLPHRGALDWPLVYAVSMIGIFIGDRSFCKLWGGLTRFDQRAFPQMYRPVAAGNCDGIHPTHSPYIEQSMLDGKLQDSY